MFNSPINKLFGISNVGKDSPKRQNKNSQQETNQDEKNNNFFNDNKELYTDISSENFDAEKYIINYLKNLCARLSNPKDIEKIEKYLSKFNYEHFKRKHGSNLTKEDVLIILYELLDKWNIPYDIS